MKRLQACLLAGLLAASGAHVVAAEQAMIVLDASGSMWGQINGKPKLQIAREALATVLEGVPADMELGLMAYGHREKGNCNDIEVIIEPAAGTGPAIAKAAAQMKFLGKTPLSAAVKQAAEALRYTEDKATVILITDGLETCKADPCALGTELAKQGIDFTAHVVGFDLTDAEGKQVACLAENTGGQYIAASNADELRDALVSTVVQPVMAAKQPEPEKEVVPVLPEATLDPDESAAVGADMQVNWTGPNADNDYIDIVPEGHKKTNDELAYTYTKQGTPLSIRMPGKPGPYQIRYIWRGTDNKRHILAAVTVQVTDSDVALIAPDTVQAGSVIPVEWKGPANAGDYIDLVVDGTKATSGELFYAYAKDEPTLELRAPTKPGNYQIRYVLRAADKKRVLADIPLVVSAATATVSIADTLQAGSPLSVFWTGPASKDDYIDIVPADYKKMDGGLDYFYPARSDDGETGDLKGPTKAGQYLVRYILRGAGAAQMIASAPLTVTASSAALSVPDTLQAGSPLSVSWTGPAGKNDYIDIVPADYKKMDGGLDYFYPAKSDDGATGDLKGPTKAGQYLVRYILRGAGAAQMIASVPLTVTASSATLSVPDTLQAGSPLSVSWTGPAGKNDYIDIVPADQKKLDGGLDYFYPAKSDDGATGDLKGPTKAGQYLIRYVLRGAGAAQMIASAPLTVTAVTASLSAPETAPATSQVTVSWTGPAGKNDYIDIVPADQKKLDGGLDYFYPAKSDDDATGELKMPKKPGQYKLRYVLRGAGPAQLITSRPLMVTAAPQE
ncbi:MAG: VWA domain-containing protein [Burkholderiaceae bacterium]|nr:VWA domain-containing protein [Burkholderiaceae bacterium]